MSTPKAPPLFDTGDEVSVYRTMIHSATGITAGAWYEATIHSRYRMHQYFVIYKTLLDSDSHPLHELVSTSDIRPTAPQFRAGDEVEARAAAAGLAAGGWYEARVDSRIPAGHYKTLKDGEGRPVREAVPGSEVRPPPRAQGKKQCETGKRTDSQIPPSLKQCEAGKRRDSQIPLFLSPSQFEGKKQCETEKRMDSQIPLSLKQCEPGKRRDRQIPLSLNPSQSEGKKQCETGKRMDSQVPLSLKQCETGKRRDSQIPLSLNLSQFEGKKECGNGKRRNIQIPLTTANQKRRISDMKTSAQGDSVIDHEESMRVNEPSVEGRGTLTSELIAEVDTLLKRLGRHELIDKLVGSPCFTLLGTSKSQYEHDEAGSGHAALLSTPRVDIAGDSVAPVSKSALPFVKRSPVWKYIDLEVVLKLRQQPHFRPLEQLPEVQREGIAVALMVNYQHLMKSCQSALKMDSSCHNLDEYLKNIIDLERYGFEVEHLRDELEELRRVRNTHTEVLKKKCAAKGQTSEVNEKSDHLDAELEATDSTIMALKQVLRFFNERRSSLAKRKEARLSRLNCTGS